MAVRSLVSLRSGNADARPLFTCTKSKLRTVSTQFLPCYWSAEPLQHGLVFCQRSPQVYSKTREVRLG